MKNSCVLGFLMFIVFGSSAFAALPSQPNEAGDPGSAIYQYEVDRQTLRVAGREVVVFLPRSQSGERFPVVAYGHGQSLGVSAYDETFNHLARKGVAVIFPTYDTGFFDQDWRRMAKDFNDLTAATLERFASQMRADQVIYAGHSKGAYVSLMAAGAPGIAADKSPKALVMFAPAGYDAEYLRRLPPSVPATLVWGEADRIIAKDAVVEIFGKMASSHRQFIEVKSYPELSADHFFMVNESSFFGGRDGVSSLHFYGAWKWLLGAVWDVQDGSPLNNTFIYGREAQATGVGGLEHNINRVGL